MASSMVPASTRAPGSSTSAASDDSAGTARASRADQIRPPRPSACSATASATSSASRATSSPVAGRPPLPGGLELGHPVEDGLAAAMGGLVVAHGFQLGG